MRRIISILIALGLCAGTIFADDHTGKTYLSPRAVGVNKAMEHSMWHHHIYTKWGKEPTRLKTHIQATPFYQKSNNGCDIGKYFRLGYCGKDCKEECPTECPPTTNDCADACGGKACAESLILFGPADDVEAKKAHIDGRFLLHLDGDPDAADKGSISFKPEQEVFGVRLDWFQNFCRPIKGLFFKASTVIAHVKNDMNLRINSEDKTEYGTEGTFGYEDFFAGKVSVNPSDENHDFYGNKMCPLEYAKMDCKSRSETGFADIDLTLGYRWMHDEKKHACIHVDATIPTGNRVRGVYVFEPIYGNGRHFGLGAGIDGGVQVWKGKKGQVRLDGGINYKYLFENTQKRTLSLKKDDNIPGRGVHYYLAGEVGQEDKPLFPLANVLTQNVSVKPGSMIDAIASVSFKNDNFIIDAGYNLYWRDNESVGLKSNCCFDCDGCNDETSNKKFVIATKNFVTEEELEVTDDPATTSAAYGPIECCNICTEAAETPSQLTHKIFGGIAYSFDLSKKYPTSLGVGASYEFVNENSALEQWAVWLKGGISF